MDIVTKIIKFEGGELSQKETINFFIELYQSRVLFGLQGFYQRTFRDLVEQDLINIKELQTETKI